MKNDHVIIAGGGMAGCFMAISLAQKGHRVTIFEKRENVESVSHDTGRSFNLTLYLRGIKALKKLSLWESVSKLAELAEGNVAHFENGKEQFDRFDTNQEVLYTIHRDSLNRTLIKEARKHKLISVVFNTKVTAVNKAKKEVKLTNLKTKKSTISKYSLLIGADGAYSKVRQELQKGQKADHSLVFSDWGYKEVLLTPSKVQQMNLRKQSTHTWPRDNSLLLAFPNPDHSSTLMFNLPLRGSESFKSLTTPLKIKRFITKYFPELLFVLPEITDSLISRPQGSFVTVKTAPWYYKDSIVLIGDAAHAVLPFYGQGMCAAFEDCLLLTKYLTRFPNNYEKAFTMYQMERKENTDILSVLSVSNFVELRDKSRSERFILKDRLYTLLNKMFPKFWLPPLYVLIAHSSLPYTEALSKFNKQEKKASVLGINLFISSVVILMKGTRFLTNLFELKQLRFSASK